MLENDQGNIRIVVRTADGALPVERAVVTVKSSDERLMAVYFTDADGKTPSLAVPAPSPQNSERPGAEGSAFALYNIDTDKGGYQSVRNVGVQVYPGITSVQPVDLVPLSENSNAYINDAVEFNEGRAPEL